ncbi:putative legumain protein [Medicago truncatula]|uniref:Putative legumain protein n=1 Tax=Medicago truncatula TaxID=3880 RepID=A0A396H739_MEDTR|nr:putative legumain protein [Medicago truncatula]
MFASDVQVRDRVISHRNFASHVTQLGDLNISNDFLVTYISAAPHNNVSDNYNLSNTTSFVSQDDAYLLHLRLKLKKALNGSEDKLKVQNELDAEIAHRKHVDNNIDLIENILFGEKKKSSAMMFDFRSIDQPLVDDWNCLKILFKTYESQCGILSTYGRKYSKAFAYMCNIGISEKQMIAVVSQVCPGI